MTDVMPKQTVDLDEVVHSEAANPGVGLDAVDKRMIAQLAGRARVGRWALSGWRVWSARALRDGVAHPGSVDAPSSSYRGHRFPAEIISHCVWLGIVRLFSVALQVSQPMTRHTTSLVACAGTSPRCVGWSRQRPTTRSRPQPGNTSGRSAGSGSRRVPPKSRSKRRSPRSQQPPRSCSPHYRPDANHPARCPRCAARRSAPASRPRADPNRAAHGTRSTSGERRLGVSDRSCG
jgi:hypothetical protein